MSGDNGCPHEGCNCGDGAELDRRIQEHMRRAMTVLTDRLIITPLWPLSVLLSRFRGRLGVCGAERAAEDRGAS